MGGRFQTNLNANVTHLVCGVCASSEKYFVNWWIIASICIDGCLSIRLGSSRKWNSSDDARLGTKCIDSLRTKVNRRVRVDLPMTLLFRTVKATDPTFERFKCPLFYKFTISLSGFSERDRTTIKQYVEREGATYSPNLIKDQCTHLICKEPKGNGEEIDSYWVDFLCLGSKYEHAIKWGIPALKPEWIFESSEKGSCLRLTNYLWPIANLESINTKGSPSSVVEMMLSVQLDSRKWDTDRQRYVGFNVENDTVIHRATKKIDYTFD